MGVAAIRAGFEKIMRRRERLAEAKAIGKVAYWAEDSLGRRRLSRREVHGRPIPIANTRILPLKTSQRPRLVLGQGPGRGIAVQRRLRGFFRGTSRTAGCGR